MTYPVGPRISVLGLLHFKKGRSRETRARPSVPLTADYRFLTQIPTFANHLHDGLAAHPATSPSKVSQGVPAWFVLAVSLLISGFFSIEDNGCPLEVSETGFKAPGISVFIEAELDVRSLSEPTRLATNAMTPITTVFVAA
jgi:hypothetical protein